MPKNNYPPFKTRVEISEKALTHNLETFQELVGRTKIFCVVKGNAYGHGLKEVVKILQKKKIHQGYAVDNIQEAIEIRSCGETRSIIVLGYTRLSDLKEALNHNLSLTVYDRTSLRKILSLKPSQPVKIHLKVETGLNRQGLEGSQLLSLASFIYKNRKYITLEGVSTHFANIEDTLDPTYAFSQLGRFRDSLDLLKKSGLDYKLAHSACTAAAMLYRNTHLSAIRLGIGLYGLWPSKETKIAISLQKKRKHFSLKPVLSWKSIVAQVKWVKTGDSVGYGRTWFAPKRTKLAIVPIGYSDGYDRGLSNNSSVLIRGKKAQLVGRVAMNMIAVDVSQIKDVKIEDEVILIGKNTKSEITADEMANRLGTISYEVVARINPQIPRIVVK